MLGGNHRRHQKQAHQPYQQCFGFLEAIVVPEAARFEVFLDVLLYIYILSNHRYFGVAPLPAFVGLERDPAQEDVLVHFDAVMIEDDLCPLAHCRIDQERGVGTPVLGLFAHRCPHRGDLAFHQQMHILAYDLPYLPLCPLLPLHFLNFNLLLLSFFARLILPFDLLNSLPCKHKQIGDKVIGHSPHPNIAKDVELDNLLNLLGWYASIFSMV